MKAPQKIIVTVEDGQLQVVALQGMDKVDMLGLLSIAQFQVSSQGPTAWIASATIEQPASSELQKLLATQRNGR